MGPAHVFGGHAFSIPGTSRACARASPPDLPFLDGPAPTDRRVTGRQGLGAGARVVNCWPRRLSRSATEVLPRRAGHAYRYGAGTLDGAGACPRLSGLLGAAGAGLQLLLGPGTSGFDVTFLYLVIDAGAKSRGW